MKALGDQTRLDMIRRMASQSEYPCTSLEHELPVGKSTISYHVKILNHAGLVSVRKKGRHYFYTLHRDVIEFYTPDLLDRLAAEAESGEA
ncbi:metalloregulator ArsR/SmtB family transcription factor [Saccharopolyspora halophila]